MPLALAAEHREAVAAAFLGLVARDLGLHEQLVGRELRLRLDLADADRDRRAHLALAAHGEDLSARRLDEGLRRSFGVLQRGLRQDHAELVAAEAPDDVGLAQPRAQQRRDGAEQFVAGRVPVAVVDVLEVVDVDRQQRRRMAVALGVADDPLELVMEAAPVVEAGQRIVIGELAQLSVETACARSHRAPG